MPKSLLSIRNLSTAEIGKLLQSAIQYKKLIKSGEQLPTRRKVVGMLFFEDSTRTRVSFEQAAYYLGMKSTNFASSSSSMNKGETLKDTILTLKHERLDALVIRHRASGSPALAAEFFQGPVINAGDGQHEHPTQALADALTILERKGTLVGLTVAIVGDVEHSRVARSNTWLLSKLGAQVRLVGPKTLIPNHCGLLPAEVFHDLDEGIRDADVVMCLRMQKERMAEGSAGSLSEYARMYQVNRERLRLAADDVMLLHPGPINRGVELDDAAADGDSSFIATQVENGIFVRMAALNWAFDEDPVPTESTTESEPTKKVKKGAKA